MGEVGEKLQIEKTGAGVDGSAEWERGRDDTNPNIQMLNKAILLYTLTCTIGSKVNCLSYMTSIWVLW